MRLNGYEIKNFILDSEDLSIQQQVGIDLTIKEIKKVKVDPFNGVYRDKTIIKENTYEIIEIINWEGKRIWNLDVGVYSITFDQGINLPNNVSAQIIGRSSLNRLGSIINSGIFDCGFATENIGAILYVNTPIKIEQHSRIAQVIMEYNKPIDNLYNGQYQNERDRK